MEQNSMNNKVKYQKLLSNLIPHLDKYSYLSGTEGNVYFVHDNYIVKEYNNSILSPHFFNNYCNEIQSFANKGFSVPKIYAWCQIPNKHGKNNFYILEERAKGKNLFNEMADMYPKVKHLCSTNEFYQTIMNQNTNPKLFTEIVLAYLEDINQTSKQLLNMEESKVNSFINTLYHLYVDAKNSFPDMHENNVMFDGKTLTIIDQMPVKKSYQDIKLTSSEQAKHQVLYDIFAIFERFSLLQYLEAFDIDLKPRLETIKKETLDNATSVIKRFGKQYQKILSPNKKLTFEEYYHEASFLFNDKLAINIAEELEKE